MKTVPLIDIVTQATHRLQQGDVVVLPTETVYGLAGDATNAEAVQKIYALKNRPAINPLIAHCADINMAEQCAVVSPLAKQVLQHFSPGPITVVLPRKSSDTDFNTDFNIVAMGCANLDTIAIRIPAHPIMHSVIQMLNAPIFAPSANMSGKLSPTTYTHAKSALTPTGQDILVVDGGDCRLGLESTIVQIIDSKIEILRHGAIPKDEIEKKGFTVGEHRLSHRENPIAPGQLKTHYAPNIPLYMNVKSPEKNHGYLGFGDCQDCHINLSKSGDLAEAGRNLFASLHQLSAAAFAAISVAPIPNIGMGIAINDKLRRAATTKT